MSRVGSDSWQLAGHTFPWWEKVLKNHGQAFTEAVRGGEKQKAAEKGLQSVRKCDISTPSTQVGQGRLSGSTF